MSIYIGINGKAINASPPLSEERIIELIKANNKVNAPLPQKINGIGQWVRLLSSTGYQAVVPSGGTWAVYTTTFGNSGTMHEFSDLTVTIVAGGSSVGAVYNLGCVWGFAWRIS